MAKRLTGTIIDIGPSGRSRGDIRYDHIVIRDERGREHRLKGVSMDPQVHDALRLERPATYYLSSFWGYLYGVRAPGDPGRFESWATRWYLPWMAIGMIFAGLATSFFLFPILVAIAGVCALLVSIDARLARSHFRRDARRGAGIP